MTQIDIFAKQKFLLAKSFTIRHDHQINLSFHHFLKIDNVPMARPTRHFPYSMLTLLGTTTQRATYSCAKHLFWENVVEPWRKKFH